MRLTAIFLREIFRRIHEEENSDNHQNTAGKKIQNRGIQFLQNIDQDMIKSYKNQQNSKYKFTDYIDRVHRHKRQARSKGDIYDRGYNLPFQKVIDFFPHETFHAPFIPIIRFLQTVYRFLKDSSIDISG